MQQPGVINYPQGMESHLCLTVFRVIHDQKRIIEENFFRFGLTDTLLLRGLLSFQSNTEASAGDQDTFDRSPDQWYSAHGR